MQIVSGSANDWGAARAMLTPSPKTSPSRLHDVAQMNADADMDLVSWPSSRCCKPRSWACTCCAHWTALTTEGKSTKKASPMVLMRVAVVVTHHLGEGAGYARPAAAACGLHRSPSGG